MKSFRIKNLSVVACLVWFTWVSPVCAESADIADTILFNGNVYTLNWGEPDLQGNPAVDAPFANNSWQADARAVAIKDGTLLFLGSTESVQKYIGPNSKVINLQGATVLPGLVDSHVHIAELGEILQRANLSNVESPQAAIELLEGYAKDLPAGEWLIGQGWDEGAWADNYPNRLMLDKAFPDNPVYLRSLHGFAVWVNSMALELVAIDQHSKAPVGGEILRDKDGLPNGILLNRATALIAERLPKPTTEVFANYIHGGMQQMAKDGFVAVHEAGAESLHIEALQQLQTQGDLPIRMYAMLSARDAELANAWQKRGPLVDPSGFLDIRSVKAYYDGALGSRGARLLADYSDRPGHRGVSGDGYGFDAKLVDKLIGSGFQVGIHAIGDAGNREVLEFFSSAEKKHAGSVNLRHRVEHAQVIHADDFAKLKQLSLIASMEPPHAVEDKTWAEDRLGSERIRGAYAWRTLREHQVPLTFNSDLPGSDHNIFYALHAAVTRRDKQSEPTEGWYAEQAVSIEEAIRAYTSWAAYAAFREHQTGVLKQGNWADLSVIDIDPFKLAVDKPSGLLAGKVLMTIVNGEIVHRDQSLIGDVSISPDN